MNNKAIYPGTFDPITNGHTDIIKRASQLFDQVVVAIASSSVKNPVFGLKRRIELARLVLKKYPNVQVVGFDTLLIEFARQHQANIIIRGLRAVSDFEYEFQLAGMNRKLDTNIETVFLTPSEQYTYLSSTLVREIAQLGGPVEQFVDPLIQEALKAHFMD